MVKKKDIDIEPKMRAELKRLLKLEREHNLLKQEHGLLKKPSSPYRNKDLSWYLDVFSY